MVSRVNSLNVKRLLLEMMSILSAYFQSTKLYIFQNLYGKIEL